MILWILGGIILFISVYVVVQYNLLVSSKNTVSMAWADIEVQLKRRYDLIPNLVDIVKGYAKYEAETIEKVIAARNAAMAVKEGGAKEHSDGQNQLGSALKSLFAVAENYPDLKASENFLKLQFELTDVEDRIKASRRYYNTNVMDYNIRREQFPGNIIAAQFNFKPAAFFELPYEEAVAASKVVEVKF